MKKYGLQFFLGLVIIFFSTPLGYFSVNILGSLKGNLSGEYVPLLNGFIASYLIIGILIFAVGFINKAKANK
ncbi:glycosyl transferase [Clostridium sp. KNHs216]|uniref:glycosyl transferase n=1 Tax=Clostridium sp. KNHs216 TaxID=1550235 RepID=UPI0011529D65|nr:glycosyl transferase [Clostridium sp. KNHs216]TQI67536.1 hypothetical protein LY85_2228 [Clostridium sp. KNHs216]